MLRFNSLHTHTHTPTWISLFHFTFLTFQGKKCASVFSGFVVFCFWLFTECTTEGRSVEINCADLCASAGHSSLHRHRQRGGKEGQVLHRSKRGWVWNQFFVIEEYTGPDPVLVGRVSTAEHWLSRTKASQTNQNQHGTHSFSF